MFPAALVTITKSREQPKFPPMDKHIKKMWHLNIMEYYLAITNMKFLHL